MKKQQSQAGTCSRPRRETLRVGGQTSRTSPAATKRFPYDFSPMPQKAYLTTHQLTPAAKDIYAYIVARVDGKQKTGWTFKVSDRDIQDTFGYRRETISRARQEIQRLNLAIQLPHVYRRCRQFYIGTPDQVRLMRIALILAFIKLAKREDAMEALKRLREREQKKRSQTCDETITNLCADGHKSVTTSSQKIVVENPPNPRPRRVSKDTSGSHQESYQEYIQEPSSPPISPSVEMLFGKWNDAKGRPEMEKEKFCKYLEEGIQKVRSGYGLDDTDATKVIGAAIQFYVSSSSPDTPCYFWKHSDGKKRLHDAVKVVREKQENTEEPESLSSNKQPLHSSNEPALTEKPSPAGTCSVPGTETSPAETQQPQDSEIGSARAPAEPSEAAPAPPTPLALVRRNLAGRASMLKAGIISPLSREDVLSQAHSGLEVFDDVPGEDVILGVWDELVPSTDLPGAGAAQETDLPAAVAARETDLSDSPAGTKTDLPATAAEVAERRHVSSRPSAGPAATDLSEKPPKADAFSELTEIQAKIVDLDQMRRSGVLSVDEVAEVAQEIAVLKRKRIALQCRRAVNVDGAKRAAFSLEDVMGQAMAGANGAGGD